MGFHSIAGLSPALNLSLPISTPEWRGTARVKCFAQEHNAMSPLRAQNPTAHSGVERSTPEATTLPIVIYIILFTIGNYKF